VEQLRQNKPSPNNFPGADWQILDELELSVGLYMDDKVNINVWLTELLRPLHLDMDFLNRVLRSAQDAVARAMQVESMTELEHIHLLVFARADRIPNGQIWGFFRIEKFEGTEQGENPPGLAVEFYLYQPGREDKPLA
jgi:hypothetical protein